MKCKYCQTEFGDHLKTCPNCGRYLGNEEEDKAKAVKRRKIWIGSGIIAIVIIFALSTFGMTYTSQKTTNDSITEHVERSSANNLGMDTKALVKGFNDNTLAKNKHLVLQAIEPQKEGNESIFDQKITNTVFLTGAAGMYDHKLLEIRLVGQPATNDDFVDFVNAVCVMIDLFGSDLQPQERAKLLAEVGFSPDTDMTKVNKTATRGNVKYQLQLIENVGYVFFIKNVNRP